MAKKNGHGGKRKGAGRPKGSKNKKGSIKVGIRKSDTKGINIKIGKRKA